MSSCSDAPIPIITVTVRMIWFFLIIPSQGNHLICVWVFIFYYESFLWMISRPIWAVCLFLPDSVCLCVKLHGRCWVGWDDIIMHHQSAFNTFFSRALGSPQPSHSDHMFVCLFVVLNAAQGFLLFCWRWEDEPSSVECLVQNVNV